MVFGQKPGLRGSGGLLGYVWDTIKANDKLHIAWCACGVVGCLMLYGVLQERIMAEPWGPEQERFKFTLFLVLGNRLCSCAIALFGLLKDGRFDEMKPVAPLTSYMAVSLSNVVATFCQYEALKYVSFPVQTLGKCAKMLPVMIWGIIIMRKRYTIKDFGLALAVTAGCTVFLMTGSVKSKAAADIGGAYALFGLLLMMGYLGFDGFTSTFQDKLFKGHQMTHYNQVLYTSLCSSVISVAGLVSFGQAGPAVGFLLRHPEALSSVLILSASASIGALFISYTIKTFGALLFATIMTTRQVLSILLSCALYMHPLSPGQWVGGAVVFSALYYQGFSKKDRAHGTKGGTGESPHADKGKAGLAGDDEAGALTKVVLHLTPDAKADKH